ncbi:MAG: hypothetical protein WCO26_15070 [Deltaproteobacteria bacterium]
MLDRVRPIKTPIKEILLLLAMLLSLEACVLKNPEATSLGTGPPPGGLVAEWAVQKEEVPAALAEYAGYSMTFDSKRNRVVLLCFQLRSEPSRRSTALWAYERGEGWFELSPSHSPTSAYSSFPGAGKIVYDPQGDRLLLFSIGVPPGPPPEVSDEPPPFPDESKSYLENRRGGWVLAWSYDARSRSWQYLPVSERPPGESGLWVVYDPKHNQVILLQAEDFPNPHTPLETWAFDCRKNTWERRRGLSSPPMNDYMSALTYDSGRDEVLLVGRPDGYERTTLRLWAYNYEDDFWEERTAGNPPSSRHNFALVYDDTLDATVLFGGTLWGADPWTKEEEIEAHNLRIPWVYNSHRNCWEKIEYPSPLPIEEYQMVYDPFNQCGVLFLSTYVMSSADFKNYILTLKIEPKP